MDKEYVQLLVWGIFGGLGFILFLVLLFCFHHRILKVDENRSTSLPGDNIVNSSMRRKWRSLTRERNAIVVPSMLREFSFGQLEAVTNHFSEHNFIKAGHSGDLYTGILDAGDLVVVKRFHPNKSERDYYQAEMDVYGLVLDQRYLVPLLGYCLEKNEQLLVYRYMKNGDLATALATTRALDVPQNEKRAKALHWITRLKIALGTAEALAHLHHECKPPLVHRNIQSSSILLAENFDVKLGSLMEAQRLDGGDAPAYDIYCFGKVLLDLLCGLDVSGSINSYADTWMLKALPLIDLRKKDGFLEMIDPVLILEEDLEKEVLGVAYLAKACLDSQTAQNLSMEKIYNMLKSPWNINTI